MPSSEFETQLATAARLSVILIGGIAVVGVLDYAQVILAPIALAIVIGLMFGPLADRIERFGIPPWVSAFAAVLIFLALIAIAATGFAVPLSDWMDRLPAIWSRLQSELTSWKGIFASVGGCRNSSARRWARIRA
ncbi:AI-2E family transporter [Roseibium aggregatum]|uniref:AI-2E family transporter n=1 Tax=Roseibium aggregatum TaxID=187304 RepID=A0A926S7E5_9HYPH|nr:AI-2E family transporter [Roseibium aggregatum]MBD1549563.1 AI-2E family transporter [Roseibium aggregatum]